MATGLHHISKRKRKHQKLQQFPHKNPWIRFLDRFLIVLAIVSPFFTLPQLIKIYIFQSASDISFISFFILGIGDIPWILYGFVHKEKPIIIAYILWLIVNFAIAFGAVIYA